MKKVVFDTSIFIHANYYIIQQWTAPEDIDSVKLARKIVQHIQSIAFNHFSGHLIIMALDSPNIFRKSLEVGYKGDRVAKIGMDKGKIHEELKNHFICHEFDYLEADDIAYCMNRKYQDCTLVSTDNDYLLMLDGGRKLFKYKQRKFIELSDEEVLVEQLLKVIDGCKGDCIPKIKTRKIGRVFVRNTVKDNPELTLVQHLDRLLDIGYIEDYDINYLCATYNLQTYKDLVPGFDKFYDSL